MFHIIITEVVEVRVNFDNILHQYFVMLSRGSLHSNSPFSQCNVLSVIFKTLTSKNVRDDTIS